MGLFRQKFNPLSGSFNLVPTGTIVTFKDGVANAAALPLSGNTLNDARITADTGHLYIWDGSTWVDSGDIVDLKWSAIEDKPSSSVANIDDAVSKKHTQGTDQGLDTGGANAVTAAQVKTAVTNSHAPHSDDQVIPDQLSDLSDDATHRLVTDAEKSTWNEISDVALNVMLNAFRIAQIGSLTIFGMVKGFMDEFEDESGVDLVNSINEVYNPIYDYYQSYTEIDNETVLLLHGNGINGSIDIIDSSSYNKISTIYGDTQIDTSVKKFGTGSLKLDGNGDYISFLDNDDFSFGTDDFTIDAWVYLNSTGTYQLVSQGDTGDSGWFTFQLSSTSFQIYCYNSGSQLSLSGTWSLGTGSWHHVALIQGWNGESGKVAVLLDGILIQSSIATGAWPNSNKPLLIGALSDGSISNFLNGYLDEVRISKGVARWTSNFTPPTSEYSSEAVNMTLISNAQVATSVPTSARIVLFEEDVDSVILNTDLKAYISRDNGITFSQVTLIDEGNYITGARILNGVADISGQPSGTDIVYKIETLNTKKLNLHGVGISWK